MTDADTTLSLLQDLFPAVPLSELRMRVDSYNNPEAIIESLFKEQEQIGIEPEVLELAELFPEHNIETLRGTLLAAGGKDKAVELLLQEKRTEDAEEVVSEITGLRPRDVRPYLVGRSAAGAAVEIVTSYAAPGGGGRVQRAAALPYVFRVNAPESVELRAIYDESAEFQKLSWDICRRALVFFRGDCGKAVALCVFLVERGYRANYRGGATPPLAMVPGSPGWVDVARRAPAPGPAQPRPLRTNGASALKAANYTVPSAGPRKIDLHGLQTAEAIGLARNTARQWWQREIFQREQHGKLEQFGQAAQFESPLSIVTGRGIHSTNGPQIRPAVIRVLAADGFKFDEESGRVDVWGRK